MKRFSVMMAVWGLATCLPLMAAQPDPPARTQRRDAADRRPAVRASQITGMNVHNPAGDRLGSVEDLVLDAESGRVRYAALSYGGFLGFGDTLVAVPWEAFTVQVIQGRNEYNLVLHATEEQIRGATGFARDNWPDFADRELARELDVHYGIERRGVRRGGRVDVRVGRDGVDVDVQPRRP